MIYWVLIERKFRPLDVPIHIPLLNLFIGCSTTEGYIENSVLWFCMCIFVTQIVYFVIEKYFVKVKEIVIIIGAILSMVYGYLINNWDFIRLPFCIDAIGVTIFLYHIGTVLGKTDITKLNKWYIPISTLTILCVLAKINVVNLGGLMLGNPFLFLTTSVSGTCLCIYISNKILNTKLEKSLCFLGKNSFTFMCIHEPIKRIVLKVFDLIFVKLNMEYNIREYLITIAFAAIVLIFLCVPVVIFINRFLPILNGRKFVQG